MITVFGSINLDLIGNVERLPRPGETVPGSAFATSPGGKGANQALAAARAGAPVRMVGAVGKDEFAAGALKLLNAGGVDLTLVRAVDQSTGVALILVDAQGENVIAVVPGANGTVSASDAQALNFGPEEVLLLQLEIPVPAINLVAARAREAGARVVLNFAPFRSDALSLVRHASHLVVNESECALIVEALGIEGGDPIAQAATLAEKSETIVIVTLGREGAVAVGRGVSDKVAALQVRAIDTVGAGDTFCGYLAAGLSEVLNLDRALSLASAAGSLACTKAGAQPSIPPRGEVELALTG